MKRSKRGFSLTELLVAVAILLILCAAAIPGIISIRNSLEMKRLNDTAREIYMAAQNSLTARKAAGTNTDFTPDSTTGECTIKSGTEDMAKLLPAGAIEGKTAAHDFVIVFSQSEGVVFEVYYSEKTALTVQNISNYQNEPDRKSARVGFYSGSGGLNGVEYKKLPNISVTITNDSELSFSVSYPKTAENESLLSNATLTITMTDESGNKFVYYSGSAAAYDTGSTPVMDSLSGPVKFRDFTKYNDSTQKINLVPGENLTITAELTKPNENVTSDGTTKEIRYRTSAAWDENSSLFASAEDGTAQISNPRHLQNLSEAYSGLNAGGNTTITAAEQVCDIDCSGCSFIAIDSAKMVSYNGNANELQNLCINGEGLFSSVTGGTLENIRIVSPQVTASGVEYAGVLAAEASSTTVKNCQVYAAEDNVAETAFNSTAAKGTGGLIGKAANCTVSNCSASLPKMSGTANVGGLIGVQTGGSVTGCYANHGLMGENGWNEEYGMTVSSSGGGLIGNASGSITGCSTGGYISGTGSAGALLGTGTGSSVSNCYSVATLETDGRFGYSISTASVPDTYAFWGDGAGDETTSGAKSLSEIKALTGWAAVKPLSVAYNTDACPGVFPYPMIEALTYYGDWVTGEKVTDIKIDNGKGDLSARYLMIPRGESGSCLLTPMNGSDESDAEMSINAEASSTAVTYTLTDVPGTNAKRLTVVSESAAPGLYGIVVKAESISVNVLVAVYDVSITLTPSTSTGITPRSSASFDHYGNNINNLNIRTDGSVTFNSTNKSGQITATVTVEPSLNTIQSQFNTLSNKTGKDVIPSVSLNEITANYSTATSLLLKDIDNSGGVFNTPPETALNSGYVFSISGENSGKARLRAEWEKDPSYYAELNVEVKGSRALISKVTAAGSFANDVGMPDYTSSEYPYRITLNAAINENITFNVTPELFELKKRTDTSNSKYTWQVYREGTDTPVESKSVTGAAAPYSFSIVGAGAKSTEEYRIVLTYEYNNSGTGEHEESTDTVFVTINRRAERKNTSYTELTVIQDDYKPDGWKSVPISNSRVNVEQIVVTSGEFAGCNTVKLAGYVGNAVNSQVKWYACTAGALGQTPAAGDWVAVTGSSGDITAYYDGEPRATVSWNSSDTTLSGTGASDSISVTGLDANYDGASDFVFLLKAVAVDFVEGTSDEAYRIIEVHVKPVLKFDNYTQTQVLPLFDLYEKSATFNSNRTDGIYSYIWTVDGARQQNNTSSLTVSKSSAGTSNIELSYGPYSCTGTFSCKGLTDGSSVQISINNDITTNSGTEIFLIEKGKARELDLSWTSQASSLVGIFTYNSAKTSVYRANDISSTVSSGSYASMVQKSTSTPSSEDHTLFYVGYFLHFGEHQYEITGKEFTRSGAQPLQWTLTPSWSSRASDKVSWSAYYHVYGLDIRDTNSEGAIIPDSGVTFSSVGATKTLYADAFFPSDLRTAESISWTVDKPELVSIAPSADNRTCVLTANQYTAGSYTATVTCTYSVTGTNGLPYRCVKNITAKVIQSGTLTLDIQPALWAEAAAAFPEDNVGNWVNQKSGSKWILVEDDDFGANVMYLKVTPKIDGTQLSYNVLKNYYPHITGDAYYIDISCAFAGTDSSGNYVGVDRNGSLVGISTSGSAVASPGAIGNGYIIVRVSAKEGSGGAAPQNVRLVFDVGTAVQEQEIIYYRTPSVKIYNSSDADVTDISLPISLAAASDPSFTGCPGFYAKMEPLLIDCAGSPMDSIKIAWALSCPEGYNADTYVTLTNSAGNPVTNTEIVKPDGSNKTGNKVNVMLRTVNGSKLIPDFRVFLTATAQCTTAGGEAKLSGATAGHALVFLPEDYKENS